MVLAKKIIAYFRRKRVVAPEIKPKLIDNISKWYIKGLIDACFYDNYESIGKGTETELKAAFEHLLSQYHDQVKSEQLSAFIKLSGQIKAIETQWEIINILSGLLQVHYSEAAAATLNKLYPRFTFSRATIMEDLHKIGQGEIANKIKHERLCKELEKLSKQQETNDKYTPEQRHANFLNKLAEINKFEGVKYDIHTTTVLELAVLENRLTDYIHHLEKEREKHGRVN
jgi:hypothetical protein